MCQWRDNIVWSERNTDLLLAQLQVSNSPCPTVNSVITKERSEEVWGWYCWHKCPHHECIDYYGCYTCPANI